ncbi:DedA family protein [Nitratifractor salsuginis DSM 16511]|uniref:DedA family protein n=1 Tax=Nitratifractor salsuginis (strain DSM 16511 / JCM 12458 / E9I37-1) TaxID=749222 RepID=E6X3G1_NITSE|nr:DedA family protein [Nitratifractor salsuginis DSM 16511]
MLLQLFSLPVFVLMKYGYVALFIWSIMEGEIGLMLTGWLISQGEVFTFDKAYLVAIAGAFIGDNAVFLFGRLFEKKALHWLEKRPGRREQVVAWFQKWGSWLIVFERFIYGTHIPALLTVSMSGYSYMKFLFYDIIGILLWAAAFLSIGYFFGQQAIELILFAQKNIVLVLFVIIIFLVLFIAQKDEEEDSEKDSQ